MGRSLEAGVGKRKTKTGVNSWASEIIFAFALNTLQIYPSTKRQNKTLGASILHNLGDISKKKEKLQIHG